ncbi:hypothetical protein D3C87_920320 [compost metagenome]
MASQKYFPLSFKFSGSTYPGIIVFNSVLNELHFSAQTTGSGIAGTQSFGQTISSLLTVATDFVLRETVEFTLS